MKRKLFISLMSLVVMATTLMVTIVSADRNSEYNSALTLSNVESHSNENFESLFATAYNTLYDAVYQTVKHKCPGGTISCTDVTGSISVLGQSISVTLYFHKEA